MAVPLTEQDVFDSSSFSSLILHEESEEVLLLDLHSACLIGDYDSVQEFIGKKADLNKINRGGWTPLMYAAYVGRDNILNSLLEAHAKVDIQSKKYGHTALMLASYCASESIIYFLLQHGTCINMQDHSGKTSLFHAVKQGHQSAVKLLASQGADVNLSEHTNGFTPLMEAAHTGHENIFSILLSNGGNLNLRTKSGKTLRQLAVESENKIIVNMIDTALQLLLPSLIDETSLQSGEVDINQGPREFQQLCRERNMTDIGHVDPSGENYFHNNSYEKSNELLSDASLSEMEKCNNESFPLHWQSVSPLPQKMRQLFDEFNVASYLPLFEKQGIDMSALLNITDDEMKALGVEKLGPRKRIKLVINKYRQMVKTRSEIDPNEQMERLNLQLQQAMGYIQQLRVQEQQYRTDFGKYVEAEQQRMRQIMYYMNDIGKNCKEAIGQMRKIKEHHRQTDILLTNIKKHPNSESMCNELRIDSALYESANCVKCDIEMVSNRLDITYKHVERTLNIAQMNIPQTSQLP